jgi:hypothetical protein
MSATDTETRASGRRSSFSMSTQTLYAELVDRCASAAFEKDFPPNGSFVPVTIKGRRYWYFQEGARDASGRQPRKYVGPDTPELQDRIKHHGRQKDDYRERRHIIAQLRRTGFQSPDEQVGRLLQALSEAGIFRMRSCLVGTAAYQVYGPLLGVRLPSRALTTSDLDLAQSRAISLAIAKDERTPALIEVLRLADQSFRPIPHSRDAGATTSYANDEGYRVEVLTENRGPESEHPVRLPAIGTDAQPLRFLDFLIYSEAPAVVLHDAGVLVNVPSPERYALHKLIVAERRRATPKVDKDLMQAEALIDVLATRRASDLRAAWRDVFGAGPHWRKLLTTALGKIDPVIRDRALHVFMEGRGIIEGLDLQFRDAPPRYDFIRDIVVFDGEEGARRIPCCISREALDDHFGTDGFSQEQRVKAFRDNRREIQEMARMVYLNNAVRDDGVVLVTSSDAAGARKAPRRWG